MDEPDKVIEAHTPAPEVPKMSILVKTLFRLYALSMLLAVSEVGFRFLSLKERVSIYRGGDASLRSTLSLFSVMIVIGIVTFIYVYGVMALRRWVLPLVLVYSVSVIAFVLIRLVTQTDYSDFALVFSRLFRLFISALVTYAAIRYWKSFEAPALKLSLQLPVLFLLIPYSLTLTLAQTVTDHTVLDDSDLALPAVTSITKSDNAYYELPVLLQLSATDAAHYNEAVDFAASHHTLTSNIDTARQYITDTSAETNAFLAAAAKPSFQCPDNDKQVGAGTCDSTLLRDLAELTTLRAAVEAASNQPDTAVGTALAVVHMGYMVATAPNTSFAEYQLGLSMMQLGLDSVGAIMNSDVALKPATEAQVVATLESDALDTSHYIAAIKAEYQNVKNGFGITAPTKTRGMYLLQYNKTLNVYAGLFHREIDAANLGCGEHGAKASITVGQYIKDAHVSQIYWPFLSPNFIGNIIISQTINNFYSTPDTLCQVNAANLLLQQQLTASMSTTTASSTATTTAVTQ